MGIDGNGGYWRGVTVIKKFAASINKKRPSKMSEILDEIEVKNNRKSFSKFSLINSFITLGLVIYLFSSIPKTIKASEGLPEPPMIILIATQLFCLTGMILMILSFTKKEPSNWFKWIGAILNIVLFLTILGSAIFARIV